MRLVLVSILSFCILSCFARNQYTPQEAWQWQDEIGVIKGFNEPYGAYPGMSTDDILRKASELGFNSVRFWVGSGSCDKQIESLGKMIATARKYNMTVSPVLSYVRDRYFYSKKHKRPQDIKDYEDATKRLITAFTGNKTIAYWDLWNEPDYFDKEDTYASMDLIEKMARWCYEAGATQPITSSIFWDVPNPSNKALKRITEVESLMDIHNFHSYDCASDNGNNVRILLDYLRNISDRPIVCSECMTRVDGSGIPRSLSVFAQEHVHFYIWGMYNNDCNWEIPWKKTTIDPYEPQFHNVLYSDGDIIDYRELQMVKDFTFCIQGETIDPGITKVDRWNHERAWKWVALGPIVGYNTDSALHDSSNDAFNAIRVKLSYQGWRDNRKQFFADLDKTLEDADAKGLRVMPVLLDDSDLDAACNEDSVLRYVSLVIEHYYCDARIVAWDLYNRPGDKRADKENVYAFVEKLFAHARRPFACQPLTATPAVNVTPFATDFDYRKAMVHGEWAGWDHLSYPAGSSDELCYRIWSMSDVVSFSSTQPMPETAWLIALCYKFGRPIFCTSVPTGNTSEFKKTLERFAISHVFWFADKAFPGPEATKFRFKPIVTARQDIGPLVK